MVEETYLRDGIYLEIFAVKDKKRINFKTVSAQHLIQCITNGMCDGFESVIELPIEKEDGK